MPYTNNKRIQIKCKQNRGAGTALARTSGSLHPSRSVNHYLYLGMRFKIHSLKSPYDSRRKSPIYQISPKILPGHSIEYFFCIQEDHSHFFLISLCDIQDRNNASCMVCGPPAGTKPCCQGDISATMVFCNRVAIALD